MDSKNTKIYRRNDNYYKADGNRSGSFVGTVVGCRC